jgi:hypothetical protein
LKNYNLIYNIFLTIFCLNFRQKNILSLQTLRSDSANKNNKKKHLLFTIKYLLSQSASHCWIDISIAFHTTTNEKEDRCIISKFAMTKNNCRKIQNIPKTQNTNFTQIIYFFKKFMLLSMKIKG